MCYVAVLLAIVALALGATTACKSPSPEPRKVPTKTSASTYSAEDWVYEAKVIRVIDGDTFEVAFPGRPNDKVRLLGIDTPEVFSPNKAGEYGEIKDTDCLKSWGRYATDLADKMLFEKNVYLVLTSPGGERGRYGRLLAFVEIDGMDFGAELLSGGYARFYTQGSSSRDDTYSTLERRARQDGVGLWGNCEDKPSDEVEIQTKTTTEASESCCKICRTGRACGDSCISRSSSCSQPRGCACDG